MTGGQDTATGGPNHVCCVSRGRIFDTNYLSVIGDMNMTRLMYTI